MPMTERAEGAARLRSFLERRGIALGSDEEDVLTGWSRGDVTSEYLLKTISPLVGYVTRRGVTE